MFKNNVKTVVLLTALAALFVGVGSLFGQGGLIIGLVLGLVFVGGSYWFSDKIAVRAAGAVPVSETDAPQLYAIVRDLTSRSGMPMPSIYISPASQPNAFATGRNQDHAAVAVTQGLLQVLDQEELRAILLHHRDQARQVLRIGGNSRFGLDVPDLLEPQPLRHVGPALVIRRDLGPVHPGDHRRPLLQLRVDAGVERCEVLLVVRPVLRIELLEALRDLTRDDLRVPGRQPVMRIPLGMDVAHRAVNLGGGNVQHGDRPGAIEVAELTRLDLRVARAEHQRRQPADLQLEPNVQQ